MTFVYAFEHEHPRPPMELKDLLGGKGANLAEMTTVLHLPVPPGFTVSTDACRAYMKGGWPAGLDDEIADVGGRVYLAKDSRLRPELLPRMYPRLDEIREVKARVDPDNVLQSDLARRLNI